MRQVPEEFEGANRMFRNIHRDELGIVGRSTNSSKCSYPTGLEDLEVLLISDSWEELV